jgi:hypothetical protein
MSHPSSDGKGKRHPRHLGRTPIHNASSNLSHPQKPVKTTKIGDLWWHNRPWRAHWHHPRLPPSWRSVVMTQLLVNYLHLILTMMQFK